MNAAPRSRGHLGRHHQEAHNSTAIEGNTLVLREVEVLLAEGRAVGDKQLAEYMEVRRYADAAVEHAISPDSGSTWTLTSPDLDGSVVQRWHIAADGKLTSWSFERLDSDDFESRIADPTTAGRMTFLPVTAPDPMRAPDPDVVPNVTQLGLPESFPMAAP